MQSFLFHDHINVSNEKHEESKWNKDKVKILSFRIFK